MYRNRDKAREFWVRGPLTLCQYGLGKIEGVGIMTETTLDNDKLGLHTVQILSFLSFFTTSA